MSDLAKSARAAMLSKAKRMGGGSDAVSVDCSDFTPANPPLHADIKTGERPISRRQFAAGGEVAAKRADRAPRTLVKDLINRDVKEANEERDGVKHRGGFAGGGNVGDTVPTSRLAFTGAKSGLRDLAGMKAGGGVRTGNKRSMGGIADVISPAFAIADNKPEMLSPLAMAMGAGKKKDKGDAKPGMKAGGAAVVAGGRIPRKKGGKVNVNIIIGSKGDQPPPMAAGPPMPPPPMPMPPPKPPMTAGPPPGLGAPMPMGPPPGASPMMGRKRGGRTYPLDAGAGSGVGRLEKIGSKP